MNTFLIDEGEDPVKATAQARGTRTYEDFIRDAFVGTTSQIAEHIEKLGTLGINYVIAYFPRVAYNQEMLREFASEIIPKFSAA